jgi:hypothetical protein
VRQAPGTVSLGFTLDHSSMEGVITKTRGTDLEVFNFGYTVGDSFGPMLTCPSTTEEQAKARPHPRFDHHMSLQQLTTGATVYPRKMERGQTQEDRCNPCDGRLGGSCEPVMETGTNGAVAA